MPGMVFAISGLSKLNFSKPFEIYGRKKLRMGYRKRDHSLNTLIIN